MILLDVGAVPTKTGNVVIYALQQLIGIHHHCSLLGFQVRHKLETLPDLD